MGVLHLPHGLSQAGRHATWPAEPARMVALDVDGTLLGHDGIVAPQVLAAIGRAVAAGLHVGLATGRMALGVTELLATTRLPGPHVLHNGAEVRMGDEVLVSWPVPRDALQAALDGCADAGIYLEVYVSDGFHVNTMDERARVHWDLLGHQPLSEIRHADDVNGEVAKVTAAVFEGGDVQRVVDVLTQAGLLAGAAGSPATPTLTYVNGTHLDADKGTAFRAAAELLGIPIEATVAVGDAANDLPLLAVAGTAIAMGQAAPEIIAAAHLVAPGVDAYGAAVALDAAAAGWR
jgi:Cof subfamily protein (haloacid dehalogenase superfamily)